MQPYECFTCHVNLREVGFMDREQYVRHRPGHDPEFDRVRTCGKSECKPHGPEFDSRPTVTLRTTDTIARRLPEPDPGSQRKTIKVNQIHAPVGTLRNKKLVPGEPLSVANEPRPPQWEDVEGLGLEPPIRPDGFPQSKIDEIKAMMLATKRGAR